MNTQLSLSQIDSYRSNGFIVLHDFLDAAELQEWRSAVDEAVGGRGENRIPGLPELDKVDPYYRNVFLQRCNLWQTSPRVEKLIRDPRLGRMITDLEDVDGMHFFHDQALMKEPWANPTAWHLDNPYWAFSSRHSASIWIALDDATPQNGCLYFLPGTHREAKWDNVPLGPSMKAMFDMYPQWRQIEPACAEMKAGSCSFHNGLTAHAAGANMTPRFRRAMTCSFMPQGSTFNGHRMSPRQYADRNVGDLLADPVQHPLLHSRRGT